MQEAMQSNKSEVAKFPGHKSRMRSRKSSFQNAYKDISQLKHKNKELTQTANPAKINFDVEKLKNNSVKKQIVQKRRLDSLQKYQDRIKNFDDLQISGKIVQKSPRKIDSEEFSRSLFEQIKKQKLLSDEHSDGEK